MNFGLYLPPLELQRYVKYYWSLDHTRGEVLPPYYQSMADGFIEVVFSINSSFKEYSNKGYVLAQHEKFRSLSMGTTIGLFGARLYPHALLPLFGVSSHELVDSVQEIDSIIAPEIIEQITESDCHEQRVDILNRHLLGKCNTTLNDFERVVSAMIQSNGVAKQTDLQKILGLSERQMERKFRDTIGISFKRYSRILRFQHSKRKFLNDDGCNSMAQIALECNYADQSHFAREFKEFSGMTASEYFKLVNTPASEEARVTKGLMLKKDAPYSA